MHPQDLIDRWLKTPPEALARLGAGVFMPVPLYRSQKTYRPVYINRDAYRRLFGAASDDEMAATLTLLFSTTIEAQNADGPAIATAYADYQTDPLGLSLSGNLGSGRAYYAGPVFNIKGEKTPLAQSAKRQFSDGLLEMERALWECLVGTSLQGAITTGLNDVLAVIDMDDLCQVVWRDQPVRRAKVIRIDQGAFDRVTHLFHNPHALPAAALHETAARFGTLEADRFTERITHGTWSPGNISPAGHLIDFDTVCALKGRGPLYSSTRWHHENRFGYEDGGLRIILRAMAEDAVINADAVTADALNDTLAKHLAEGKGRGLLRLMGFADADALYAANKAAADALCDLWQALARKVYARTDAFSLKDARAQHVHVFDFSSFFARYPLSLRLDRFDAAGAVAACMENALQDDMLAPPPAAETTAIEQEHIDAVNAVIGEAYVRNAAELPLLQLAALGFCKKYDRLFCDLLAQSGEDLLQIEARAMARNDDRIYLFPALTVTFRLAENVHGLTPAQMQGVVQALIDACRRPARTSDGHWQVFTHLFRQGCFAVELDGQGRWRPRFRRYDDAKNPIEIEWKNERIALDAAGCGPWRGTDALLDLWTREAPLHETGIAIYSQNEHKEDAQPL